MSSQQLEELLDNAKSQIGDALASARAELATLNDRRRHLEALIAQAELLQAPVGIAEPEHSGHLTLHEAIAVVLRERDNQWMTAREIAVCVTERGLYRKKDGSRVETNQIHARTKNYDKMFEKLDSRIRLSLGAVKV